MPQDDSSRRVNRKNSMIVSNFRIISVGCLNCDEKIDLPQKNSHKKRDSISFSCASCQEQYEVIIMDRK